MSDTPNWLSWNPWIRYPSKISVVTVGKTQWEEITSGLIGNYLVEIDNLDNNAIRIAFRTETPTDFTGADANDRYTLYRRLIMTVDQPINVYLRRVQGTGLVAVRFWSY